MIWYLQVGLYNLTATTLSEIVGLYPELAVRESKLC